MAGNVCPRKNVSKAVFLPATSNRSTLIPLEIKVVREPWELRVFNNIDKIFVKAAPTFLILSVAYLVAHLAWAIIR
jgi:hypothetical protein